MNDIRLKMDNVKLWVLVGLSAIIIYFLPGLFNYVFFLSVLAMMVLNRRYDYFWIAFWFIIFDGPGDLFESGSNDGSRQLPYLGISGGVISLKHIIPLVFLFKAYYYKSKKRIYLLKDYFFLLILFMGYFALGFVYGMSLNSIFNTLLILISWTFIVSLPRLLSYDALVNFDRLLFTVVFVAFGTQIYTFTTGNTLLSLVGGTNVNLDYLKITEDFAARYISCAYIILYCLIKAFFYQHSKTNPFSRRYTNLIIIISLLTLFLSGTRGWILACIALLLLVVFFLGNRKRIIPVAVILGILVLSSVFMPGLRTQIANVFERMSTVEQIAKGDLTMGGSLARVTSRAPKVLKPFYEKQLLGEGFSDVYWVNRDRHVGHPVVLLNNGILGYIVLTLVFFRWLYIIYSLSGYDPGIRSLYGNAPKVLAFGFVFVFVIHSTSHMFWGFELEIGPMMTIILFLTNYNAIRASGIAERDRLAEMKPDQYPPFKLEPGNL